MRQNRRAVPYQYEPLVTPGGWHGSELQFAIRLTQIVDDLYQKYGALRQKTKNVEPSTPTDEPVDADTLNGKTADDFLAVDGTAVNAEKLGGKAPKYYLPAVNLLDNSNFKNPVNQRGVSGAISATGYFVDRWKLVSGSVTVDTDGLTLNGEIAQILENAPADAVTAAASAGTASFDAATNTFSLTASGELIKWAALYEGSYTADTLPPYVPKGYVAELLECQRYFFPLDRGCICFGSVNKWGSTFYGTIYTPVAMRTKPSISTTSNNYSLTNNGTQVDLTSTLTVQQMTGNTVQIMMDVTNKGMGAAMVTKLWITADPASAYLSADL